MAPHTKKRQNKTKTALFIREIRFHRIFLVKVAQRSPISFQFFLSFFLRFPFTTRSRAVIMSLSCCCCPFFHSFIRCYHRRNRRHFRPHPHHRHAPRLETRITKLEPLIVLFFPVFFSRRFHNWYCAVVFVDVNNTTDAFVKSFSLFFLFCWVFSSRFFVPFFFSKFVFQPSFNHLTPTATMFLPQLYVS